MATFRYLTYLVPTFNEVIKDFQTDPTTPNLDIVEPTGIDIDTLFGSLDTMLREAMERSKRHPNKAIALPFRAYENGQHELENLMEKAIVEINTNDSSDIDLELLISRIQEFPVYWLIGY